MSDYLDNSPASQSSGTDSYASSGSSYTPFSPTTHHPPPAKDAPVQGRARRQLSVKEKEARKLDKEKRAKVEEELLCRLTEDQLVAIENALSILRESKSRWLVMVFKRVAAVRSRELFYELGDPERFFEPAGDGYWREAWHIRGLGKQDEHASKKRLGPFITKLLDLFGK
jgi:hypothetical protein